MKYKRQKIFGLTILLLSVIFVMSGFSQNVSAATMASNPDLSASNPLTYWGEIQDLGTGFSTVPMGGKFHVKLTGSHSYVIMDTREATCADPSCAIGGTLQQWLINTPSSGTKDIYFSKKDISSPATYTPDPLHHLLLEFFEYPYNSGDKIYGSTTDSYVPGSCQIFWGYNYCDSLSDIYFGLDDDGIRSTTTISSDVSEDTTWVRGITYLVSGNINIDSGKTLTIEPGTVVKFDTGTPSSLTVNGTLVANGIANTPTSTNFIFFTSYKDDSFGIDTNNDGNATSPTNGDWGGIKIASGGSASFDYSVVQYAGGDTDASQIYNNGGALSIDHSTVTHSSHNGIKNSFGSFSVNTTDIGLNDIGIYFGGGSMGTSGGNIIHSNTTAGAFNSTTSLIGLENNFWGDPTGPYHSTHTTGLGDHVSDYIDFCNWNDAPHFVGDVSDVNESRELRWMSTSSYTTEVSSAVSTWDAMGRIDFINDPSTPTVTIEDEDRNDLSEKGSWTPGTIKLNTYYLDDNTSSQIQNTIAHEIGHSLKLKHSYSGNVMNEFQTAQTTLGTQDVTDYNYAWPII